jgi:hypothetical protein
MRDNLKDIIEHTVSLGNIDTVKVLGTDQETVIKAVAEDRTVVLTGKFKSVHSDFAGTFGMPNLSKLKTILGFDEYDENAVITMTRQAMGEQQLPASIHFETATGDFVNDYRLMSQAVAEEKVKDVKFGGAVWKVDFEPKTASIQRMKKQSQANTEETNFRVKVDNGNLKIYFGNVSTHSGNFVFESNVKGQLQHSWSWPVKVFLSIMDLNGDKRIYISDQGAMRITVDSGLAEWEYLLPAEQAK